MKIYPLREIQKYSVFYIRDFHEFSSSSGSIQDFEIFFELNGYFYLQQLHEVQLRQKSQTIKSNNYF
jgi:hypothetical protein